MRFVIGLLLNVVAFLILALRLELIAAVIYIVSIALLLVSRPRRRQEVASQKREVTPDEIKRRPVAAPEA